MPFGNYNEGKSTIDLTKINKNCIYYHYPYSNLPFPQGIMDLISFVDLAQEGGFLNCHFGDCPPPASSLAGYYQPSGGQSPGRNSQSNRKPCPQQGFLIIFPPLQTNRPHIPHHS